MISKPGLIAAALLAVLGIGVVVQSVASGHDESAPSDQASGPANPIPLGGATPSERPTRDGEPDASGGPTTNEHEVDEPQVINAAAAVAESAIQAYTQYSFRDPKQTSWIDRVAAYATDGYHHALVEQFGGNDPYWDQEVVPNQRETRTEVTDVVPDGMHRQTAKAQVYTVTYETSLRTKDMGHWGDADPMTQWVFLVKQGNTWKVQDIRLTGSRTSDGF